MRRLRRSRRPRGRSGRRGGGGRPGREPQSARRKARRARIPELGEIACEIRPPVAEPDHADADAVAVPIRSGLLAPEHEERCPQEQAEVESQRPAAGVGDIEVQCLRERRVCPGLDLPETCDARRHEEPLEVVWSEEFRLVGDARPRPHERHAPLKHIDQLGPLIDTRPPEPAAHARDRIGALKLEERLRAGCSPRIHDLADVGAVRIAVGPLAHRPELEDRELLLVHAEADLTEEHGAGRVEPYEKGGQAHQRQREQEEERGPTTSIVRFRKREERGIRAGVNPNSGKPSIVCMDTRGVIASKRRGTTSI